MTELSILDDYSIHQEMMSHTPIFSHPHPKKIAIIGDKQCGILREALKHANLTQLWNVTENETHEIITDNKVIRFTGSLTEWMASIVEGSLDIIIITQPTDAKYFQQLLSLLHEDGMLVQQSDSTFDLPKLKTLRADLINAGCTDTHFLSFSQPNFPSGWRTSIMAMKTGNFRRIREKDIFNKTFSTRYYNFDIHKASLVLPEFMREELEPSEV